MGAQRSRQWLRRVSVREQNLCGANADVELLGAQSFETFFQPQRGLRHAWERKGVFGLHDRLQDLQHYRCRLQKEEGVSVNLSQLVLVYYSLCVKKYEYNDYFIVKCTLSLSL